MKKVYIHYVDNSEPLIKKFKTLTAARAFAKKFGKKGSANEGYWVDFIVVGEILDADEYYKSSL